MRPRFTRILTLLPLVSALASSSSIFAKDARTISVAGKGNVASAPDQVELSIGIDVTEKKVETSKSKSDDAMRRILAVTREYKIDNRDVQSDYIRIQPIHEDGSYRGNESGGKPIVYNSHRELRILLRDISKYEGLVAALFNSGANNLSNVVFRASKAEKMEAEARLNALKDAKSKAEAIAQELGLKLGRPLTVTEGSDSPGPIHMMKTMALRESSNSQEPTLALGEISVKAELAVTYEAD